MPLVNDDGLKPLEQGRCLGVGQQHTQRFRRGDQDLRWGAQLFAALVGRRIAIADSDTNRPAHGRNRLLNR